MRLFIGVEISDEMKTRAVPIADDLRDRFARLARSAVLRWVSPENLHITLWFVGEVDDEQASALRGALAAPFATASFDLHARGVGMFPSTGPPRALWVGLADGAASLVAVYKELIPRLERLGFEPERRAYAPHLTIARFKDIRRADVPAVRRVVAQCTSDAGSCRIAAVTLFRSRLSPRGAQYEPLIRVPLS
jgi:RNA 2',3'-cyclic 3'-phosphodiesterase